MEPYLRAAPRAETPKLSAVGDGQDGPTHQPIETIPSLRLIPDLTVIRPADGNETAGAYAYAVERSKNERLRSADFGKGEGPSLHRCPIGGGENNTFCSLRQVNMVMAFLV